MRRVRSGAITKNLALTPLRLYDTIQVLPCKHFRSKEARHGCILFYPRHTCFLPDGAPLDLLVYRCAIIDRGRDVLHWLAEEIEKAPYGWVHRS